MSTVQLRPRRLANSAGRITRPRPLIGAVMAQSPREQGRGSRIAAAGDGAHRARTVTTAAEN
jgi:hypothetical protein